MNPVRACSLQFHGYRLASRLWLSRVGLICASVCHLCCYVSAVAGKTVSGEVGEDGEPLGISTSRVEMDDDGNLIVKRPKISGKIKLTYDADEETERAMEVDADAYMAELRGQVCMLVSFVLDRGLHRYFVTTVVPRNTTVVVGTSTRYKLAVCTGYTVVFVASCSLETE